jgi:hypothetical protein
MLRLKLAVSAVVLALVTLTGSVAQTTPPKFPLAIFCFIDRTQTWRVAQLSSVKDGTATYVVVGTRLSATLSASGVVEPTSGRVADAADCYGKTLDWLRAAGRVVELRSQ